MTVLFLLKVTSGLWAQEPVWVHLSKENSNLSSNFINDIVCHDNKVWIATENGLNIVDLNNTNLLSVNKAKDQEFPFDDVNFIKFLPQDELCVGAYNGSIVILNNKNFKPNQVFNSPDSKLNYSNLVNGVEKLQDHVYIAAFHTTGVYRLSKNENNKSYFKGKDDEKVNNILLDRDKTIWVATTNGLYIIEYPYEKTKKFPKILYATSIKEVNGVIYVAVIDNTKNPFLYRVDKKGVKDKIALNAHLNSKVLDIVSDSDGFIWVMSQNHLIKINPKAQDRKIEWDYKLDDLNGAYLSCLATIDSTIILGTYDRGIFFLGKKASQVSALSSEVYFNGKIFQYGDTVQLENVYFEKSKEVMIDSSSLPLLVSLLKTYNEVKIKIIGHTENIGNEKANLKLSQMRAETVKKWLVNKGIEASRLEVSYWGGRKAVSNDLDEEKRKKNRRVEIVFLGK